MRLLTFLLVCALVMAPAFADKTPPSDDRIVDEVRVKLAGDPEVGRNSIDVEVHGGNVILRGKVKKEKQRSKAEHLAKKVKGVKSVSNQLTVGE